jgi:hypothetical protein
MEYSDVESQKGDEPPDYFFICDGKKYLLEIRQCFPLLKDGGKLIEVEQYYASVLKLGDKINDRYKELLPDDYCLTIYVETPIHNYKKFKKALVDFVKEYVTRLESYSMNGTAQIAEEKVDVRLSPGCKEKCIIIGVSTKNNSHEFLVNKHVKNMIEKAIAEKSKKMSKFQDRGNNYLWLGLLNNNMLAHENNICDAFKEIDIVHCFSRIYIVMRDRHVLCFDFNIASASK